MLNIYIDSIKERLRSAFPGEAISADLVVPYIAQDDDFSQQVTNFFGEKAWGDVSLEGIKSAFLGERINALYFLGWEAKRIFLPSMIVICLDGYASNEILIETVECILLNQTDIESDDASETYDSWIDRFSKDQIAVIIDFIVFMRADLGNIYLGTMFNGDFSPWIAALDKKNSLLLSKC